MTRLHGSSFVRSTLALVAVVGMAASIVHAEPDPLKGPKVEPRNVPGDHGQFGEGKQKDRKGGNMDVPHVAFMRIVNSTLNGADAAADIKLTADQQGKIKTLNEEFEKKTREYRQQHAKEFEQMQKEMGGPAARRPGKGGGDAPKRPNADGGGGDKPGGEMNPEMTPEQREKMTEKFRELRENAPKQDDVRTAIWTLLTEPQKKAVQVKLDAFRDEALKRRAEQETERKLKKQGDGKPGAGQPNREEIRKKLEGMSPEEREKFLQDLRKRKQQGDAPASPSDKKPD